MRDSKTLVASRIVISLIVLLLLYVGAFLVIPSPFKFNPFAQSRSPALANAYESGYARLFFPLRQAKEKRRKPHTRTGQIREIKLTTRSIFLGGGSSDSVRISFDPEFDKTIGTLSVGDLVVITSEQRAQFNFPLAEPYILSVSKR